jgi:hypothetical protein
VTALTPGMRVEVVTVTTATPSPGEGPPEAAGFIPYTGPGTWLLYGFTGKGLTSDGTWVDLRLCNECAIDPVKVEPVRQKCMTNLRIDNAGKFIAVTYRDDSQYEPYGCQACGRKREGDRRTR